MVKYIFFRVRVRDRVGVRFISNVNYSVFSFPEGQMYDMNGCALADPSCCRIFLAAGCQSAQHKNLLL